MVQQNVSDGLQPVIIGAGPAGLTAAVEFLDHGVKSRVFEADSIVGGISRTVESNGWRFDIGGHRFFTKVPRVEKFWHRVLPDGDFMMRPRLSRIYYKKKFYDYPLKASNALGNLGILEAVRCVLSYVVVRLRPPRDQSNFEGWTASRFGWRLYNIFFKGYTEKVWGVKATEIQADWAAQRIKNLSLLSAVVNALMPKRNQKDITSLIEEFQYPKLGPGMLWERCVAQLEEKGVEVSLRCRVSRIRLRESRAVSVVVTGASEEEVPCTHVISSMPLSALLEALEPAPPGRVLTAARNLRYRDFITVALVVDEKNAFPDNWIYIHEPRVNVGRVQNFGSWSPHMVKPGYTCLGLEYFVFEGDDLWTSSNESLIALATKEMQFLGLLSEEDKVHEGYVVRMPKAYPLYDADYKTNVEIIRLWLDAEAKNVFPVGRNGMHKYNNQDHSMLTSMLTVDNILGASHDTWSVNVEEDYHEEYAK